MNSIKNKTVIIEKTNTFNQGWSLFKPFLYDLNIENNDLSLGISYVLKAITYATKINLILNDNILPKTVRNELEWVNKYIDFSLIAKDYDIAKKYSDLSFDNIKIDKSINFAYLHIEGKTNVDFIFEDQFYIVDSRINEVYFEHKNITSTFDYYNDIRKFVILNEPVTDKLISIITKANSLGIEVDYIFEDKCFNRQDLITLKGLNVNIYASELSNGGIIAISNDNKMTCIRAINNLFYIAYEIGSLKASIGKTYKHCGLDGVISKKELSNELYSCLADGMVKLDNKPAKILTFERNIDTIENFVNEKFDNEICNHHNDYANEYEKTKYIFTLIPPLLDETYQKASIYNEFDKNIALLKANKFTFLGMMKTHFENIEISDCGLFKLIDKIERYTTKLLEIEDNEFKNYNQIINQFYDLLINTKENLLENLIKLFNEANERTTNTKYDCFDDEINGYKATIEEKQELIRQGKDILSNKRRVDLLNHKIEHLMELKANFIAKNGDFNSKSLIEFKDKCNKLLNNEYKEVNSTESLENVITLKQESKTIKLDKFLVKYLVKFNDALNKNIEILKAMKNNALPDGYNVYEKGNELYIAIKDLDEIETSRNICEKFNLKCIVRR